MASRLQSSLQKFAKPFYQLRNFRVFRDETTLSLTPELWTTIQKALKESEHFIFLASPRAAQSIWVPKEIDEWLGLQDNKLDKFMIVLTEGNIVWNNDLNDFDWNETTALPSVLQGKYNQEPLYLDFRWAKTSTDLSLRNPKFLKDIGKIASQLHNKKLDEMVGEDIRQHRIFKLISGIVIAILILLLVATSGTAYYANEQRKNAEEQKTIAENRKIEADNERDAAIKAKNETKEALDRETEAKNLAETRRLEAEKATENERIAKNQAEERRKQAEQATENERIAKNQAEERRKEAERQTNLAKKNLSTSDFYLGDTNLRNGDIKDGLFWSWRAYYNAPLDDLRKLKGQEIISSWISKAGDPIWHKDSVDKVLFSSDGQHFVTVSRDYTVNVWDTERHTKRGQTISHNDQISDLDISFDNRILFTGSRDNTARFWDLIEGTPLSPPLQHDDVVTSVAFHPKRLLAITGSTDGVGRVWNATNITSPLKLNHDGEIEDVAFSPDGSIAVTAGGDRIRFWNLETGLLSGPEISHEGVKMVKFSPDGSFIASGSTHRNARIWLVRDKTPIGEPLEHKEEITALAFSPNGNKIATSSLDSTVRIWETLTSHSVGSTIKHELPVASVGFTPDGQTIVTASYDRSIRFWSAENGTMIGTPVKHERGVVCLSIDPNGRYIVTGSEDKTARIWDMKSIFPNQVLSIDISEVESVVLSHNNRILAIGGRDGIVQLRDAETFALLAPTFSHESLVKALSFSVDDQVLFVATDTKLYRWDLKTHKLIGPSSL